MEYRGIRYTIRAGIERGQYRVVIHPDGTDLPSNRIAVSRAEAEVFARRMINEWLEQKSGTDLRPSSSSKINICERLSVVVAECETGGLFLNSPRRREAAARHLAFYLTLATLVGDAPDH